MATLFIRAIILPAFELRSKIWRRSLATVILVGVLAPSTDAHASLYKICLAYPDNEFYDASVRLAYDWQEDRGRNGSAWPMRYMYLSVVNVTGGANPWFGQTDINGCSAQFSSSSDRLNIYYGPFYWNTATGTSFQVYECDTDGTDCSAPLSSVLSYDVPASSGTYTVTVPQYNYPIDIYLAAEQVFSRFGAGYSGTPSHFYNLNYTGVGGDTSTSYDAYLEKPIVNYASFDARSKFTIAHELGHAIVLDRLGEPYEFDCSLGTGDEWNHTMQSQEYASCASMEGFGDFVAGLTWNYVTQTDGYRVQVFDPNAGNNVVWDIETGSKKILDYCDPEPCDGYGTEYDWLRFWWDYRTNSGTQPTNAQILDVLEAAHPWDTDLDHYDDLYDATNSVLGGSMASRFASNASFNGTDW